MTLDGRPAGTGRRPRLLLCGELAYNPERVRLLAAEGFDLLGRWIGDPLPFMTTGPLPYVHDAKPAERVDAVYALLNWRAIPLALEELRRVRRDGVPFVWHFKEAPQRAVLRGTWPALAELHEHADVVLYASEEERAFMDSALPDARDPATTLVLDGDLPRASLQRGEPPRRISAADGAVHTVLAGRPYGIDDALVDGLARRGVHLHVHGGGDGLQPSAFLHLHAAVAPEDWVAVLGRYDAGWLHPHRSANDGDLRRAVWDDLNVPARFATYIAAGIPVVQPANRGHRVATQSLVRRDSSGVLYDDLDELLDGDRIERARAAARAVRARFTFDAYAPELARRLRGLLR